jgi:patatin-like phospholipase/acyl hydrolase
MDNLWLNTPAANATNVTIGTIEGSADVDASTTVATNSTMAPSTAPSASPSTIDEASCSTTADGTATVDNPGLNTWGDTAYGTSHVQKFRHWKQKINDMQGTSVEIK